MDHYQHIDVHEFERILGAGPVRLVDVRTHGEVERGLIEGAMHLPLHLLPARSHEIDRDGPTVFYCRSGVRSAQACAYLAAQGHRNLYNLQGGIMAWLSHGRPLLVPA